ncbi:MAG: MBL fold metallo-hydrolase [Ignavibacteria bacterium]|nr:MBL fold metallo-hydrolase [Ignavibacteria bacterium]
MNKKTLQLSFALIFLSFLISCSSADNFVLHHQVTGLIKTNSYLLYSEQSKEGALFDVADSIDSLESIIEKEGIKLKYIFITHCHPDHVFGVPTIKERYPEAKICFSNIEYEDTKIYSEWEENLDSAFVASVKEKPALVELMNFDFKLLGKPAIELTDNQIYKLGELEIKTFLSPGHSRGSICFYTDSLVLSGDVLFYRSVGRSDLPKSGSKEDIIKSVRRLYNSLPDETKVYPGHGQFTDIGTEKKENKKVTLNSVNF